ncbi:integrase/recombinase XerD [Paenibacillus turicensis]|uniref:Integrase/recombinase XerD n=1 Tax=Paenibacillus turicensis TaxID=160487 RepID=A0ABS4FSG9_9BACL|nr:tyrosine-type recombinase/integrase [Paenibacillus turicensis]MBP1905491.1 integrase/recombinase XerD [Paenibacillus turicensis]
MSNVNRVRRTNAISAPANGLAHALESTDFDAAISALLRDCKERNLSIRTSEYYEDILTMLARELKERHIYRPIDVKKTHIMEIITDKREREGKADATMNKYIRGWRAFFNFLRAEGHITDSPFDTIREIKSEKKIIQTFTEDQIKKLMSVPNRNTFTGFRDAVIMLLMLDTGLRLEEVEGIRIDNIYWKERQIKVRGKGNKERLVPFSPKLDEQLREYVAHRGLLEHDFVFVNIDNKPFKRRGIQQAIKNIGAEAGIKGVRVSPHTFRHTFSKMYIMQGGDAFSLQKILGHTSLDVVRIYVNLFGVDLSGQHTKYSPLNNLDI